MGYLHVYSLYKLLWKDMDRLWSQSKYMYVFHNYNSHTRIRQAYICMLLPKKPHTHPSLIWHAYICMLIQNIRKTKTNIKLSIVLALASLPACRWCCSQRLQACPLGNQTPLWSPGTLPPQTCHLKCPFSVRGEAWKLPDRRAWNTWSSTGRACHLGSLPHFPPSKHNCIYILRYE